MISRFTKDPRQRDLKYELDALRNFLEHLKQQFPNTLIIFKEGNHEARWKNFLLLKAPELLEVEEFRLDILLKLRPLGIKWIDNKKIIRAGKLNIIHGHEYPSNYSPVNPAKGVYNRAQANVLIGHHHRTSNHIDKDLNNEITGAWSVGCLCDLQPDYMPYNKHNHGFAMVEVGKKSFNVINHTIINGEII